jgi:cytochrome bd ubiquinol oxidase subunit II
MVEVWYGLLCVTLVLFAVLDGWNIGAGLVHLAVARSRAERGQAIVALGPLWSWNEVWLVAMGGTLALAFPRVMGVAFAGLYLPLWLVLWAFVVRGIAIEVRNHLDDPLWHAAWDFGFAAASGVLAVLLGTILGAVIRGLPLDESGRFSLSLFTDFRVTGRVGLLDWYTLSTAAYTVVLLAAHGCTFLGVHTGEEVHARCGPWARRLWLVALALFPILAAETWVVRPDLFESLAARPIAWLGCAVAAIGAAVLWRAGRTPTTAGALAGSSSVIAGLLWLAAASAFPIVIRSTIAPVYSLTAHAGATSAAGLALGLWWWLPAAALALAYAVAVVRGYTPGDAARDPRRSH